MKEFHFSKIYFNKLTLDDPESNIIVRINEKPSLDVEEEDYSLRVETSFEKDRPIHRNYAIEHHRMQKKHQNPHLQFKFSTEHIVFRLNLKFKDAEEYKKAILGFIYKIKKVLGELEELKPGITEEILVLELVDELREEELFLNKKIIESKIEFDEKITKKELREMKENPLLISFFGNKSIAKIEKDLQ